MSITHPTDETKECPSCAESIRAKAVRCRFCGFDYETMVREDRALSGPSTPRERPIIVRTGPNSFQSCLGCLGTIVLGVIILTLVASCGSPDVSAEGIAGGEPKTVQTEEPRFAVAKIDAMKAQLSAEPKVVDLLYNPSRLSVEWQIGVHSDGTPRHGYAGYICQRLREADLVDDDVDVRIVDVDYLRQHPGDFRGGSLGVMRCHDELVIS